ncbi:Chaperone protein DnaJ [Bienertia sinuspersici]
MEDIGLVQQGFQWVQSQKHVCSLARTTASCLRDRVWIAIDRHWPNVCNGCKNLWTFVVLVVVYWKDSFFRGFKSLIGLQSAALLVIMWSCFLSLTSISCLVYVLISMVAAGVAVQYLGYTPGIFIVGLFAILILWMYANFWITGILFVVGGYLFSLNHARLVVLMALLYSIYCVKVRVGLVGPFLSVNLSFLSNDAFTYLVQWCDTLNEGTHFEEHKASEAFTEDNFSGDCEYSIPSDESEGQSSSTSSSKTTSKTASRSASRITTTTILKNQKEASPCQVVKEDKSSLTEMRRILGCGNHYEALGFPRHKKIDAAILKKEYRKKAMLVHPDKNMGSPLASESFKKLQCAYEEAREFFSEESRRIQCTKCGHSHIWVCTNRPKAKARWIAVSIIKLRMEMAGLNTKDRWSSMDLKR